MWWDRSELAEVYLSSSCIGLASGRVGSTRWIDTDGLVDGIAHLVDALTNGPLRSCGRVRIWLGAELARPLVLSSTSGARTREEAKALATMQAPGVTGLEGPFRVWANAWRRSRGGLAVVMPNGAWTALLGAIDQVRAERARALNKDAARSLKLVSVRPWWNQVIDAVIADCAGEGRTLGWSLTEGGGVVHGIVDNGSPVEVGFDLLGPHDGDGALLRRRLQVNWDVIASPRHLEFARQGEGVPAAIGSWRLSGGGRV